MPDDCAVAAVLEDAVRRGLDPGHQTRPHYAVKPVGSGGLRPGVDIAFNSSVAEALDENSSLDALRYLNVLVYAHRADLPEHAAYRSILERLANGDEPLGLPDLVLSGFHRVVTNRRIFTEPTSPHQAWAAIDALVDAPAALTRPSAGTLAADARPSDG